MVPALSARGAAVDEPVAAPARRPRGDSAELVAEGDEPMQAL
jgi:hypothetical protein